MQLLFADETEKTKGKDKLFFCICSIAIDESKVIETNRALSGILVKYGLSSLKESRKSGLSEGARLSIAQDITDILGGAGAKVRAIVIGEFTMSRPIVRAELYSSAMSFILERWYFTLNKNDERGIAIFDSMDSHLQRDFGKKFAEYVATEECKWQTKSYGFFRDRIHPSLLFTADENSILIQAADCIGTALNNAYANSLRDHKLGITDLPNENKFLKIFWPLFMRSPGGRVPGYGIKIWN